MLIDTHCHINDLPAFPNPGDTLQRAAQAGVEKVIVIGTELGSMDAAIRLADQFENVWIALGFHPSYTSGYTKEWLPELRRRLEHSKVVGLGEIGLDYHYDYSPRETQMEALVDQLDLADELDLPIVFHCREASEDLLSVLEKRENKNGYLVHCFSGNASDSERLHKLGAYIGVDGPITYPKAQELRNVVSSYPRDRILIETDSPYLSPVPFRGKPNEPANVSYVNKALAALWGVTEPEAAQQTTANAHRFFERMR